MLNSPQFLQQMSSMMSNPAVLDQVIASNPQLAAMGPQVREVFQSERFRQMMSNPDTLRMMLQMSSIMREAGGPNGASGGFPAPGLPSTARQGQGQAQQTPAAGTGQPFFNPFFPPPADAPTSPGAGAGAGAAPGAGAPGGMFDPAVMQQMMNMFGGGGAGGDPLGFGGLPGGFPPFGQTPGFGAAGAAPAAPADTRSPEERFQVQLQVCSEVFCLHAFEGVDTPLHQQLQDMGFTNASQNVRALLATGGNVHAAIEYILGGGGL